MLRLTPDLQALAYTQGRQFDVHFRTPHGVELDSDSFGLVVRARITRVPSRSGTSRTATGSN